MTKVEKYNLTVERYNKLKESPKNIKCGGVLKKLRRQIRHMETELAEG